jgi:uncharacterized protein with ATP-grasp and redox domains
MDIDLPLALMASEPGSFAEYTVLKRMPQIIHGIIKSGVFGAPIVTGLRALESEIAGGKVAALTEETPDRADWLAALRLWEGCTWRELPWYLAEAYFYRRVLEVTTFFQNTSYGGVDPYAPDKATEQHYALADMSSIVRHIPAGLTRPERLTLWLHRSLWGNRADLSNREVLEQARLSGDSQASRLLLVDHTSVVLDMLASGRVRRLIIVTDNYGLELLSDLMLADELLTQRWVQSIVFEVKPQPFFVSDATMGDFASLLQVMQGAREEAICSAEGRLKDFARAGRVRLTTHPFWASAGHFTEMPLDLRTLLAESDLIVFKGDVNYRRLVEDRHWPPTTDLAAITGYMPAPFLVLRTLKSEVVVGLEEGVAEATAAQDAKWLINGERGVIQLVLP